MAVAIKGSSIIGRFGLLAICLLVQSIPPAYAASTATGDVTLTIEPVQRISGTAALDLGTYSGAGEFKTDDNVCVYNNQGGAYRVKVNGGGTAGAFRVISGGHTVNYHVFWNNQANTTSNTEVTDPAVALAYTTGAATTPDCGAGVNANIQVKFAQTDLLASPPGNYSDTVTITILPPS